MPRPEPAPEQQQEYRQCSYCQHSEWRKFQLFCREDFTLHDPLDAACAQWRDLEHKDWPS